MMPADTHPASEFAAPQADMEPITDEWLTSVGFKWHRFDRQPDKHWLLWLGDALGKLTSYEDLGIEVTTCAYQNRHGEVLNADKGYFVWLRSDCAGRYSRFLHVRHMKVRRELVALVEAITGQDWNPDHHLYGSVRTPGQAETIRKRDQDLDRRIMRDNPWNDMERDDSRGRALPGHMKENIERGGK